MAVTDKQIVKWFKIDMMSMDGIASRLSACPPHSTTWIWARVRVDLVIRAALK